MLDEGFHAAVIAHDFFIGLWPTQVAETYGNAGIQKGQFAEAVLQRLAVKLHHGEDGGRGPEAHACALFSGLNRANQTQGRFGFTQRKAHGVLKAIAENGQLKQV